MTPGQHECERAVEELRKVFQQVDKAMMNVESLRKSDKSSQVNIHWRISSMNKRIISHSSFIKNSSLQVHIFSSN